MGGGLKPNSNVPIVDVPKMLRRGGVRPNWDNVLKYVFFKASIRHLYVVKLFFLSYGVVSPSINFEHDRKSVVGTKW